MPGSRRAFSFLKAVDSAVHGIILNRMQKSFILAIAFSLFSLPVVAHGPADWIQRGYYTNSAGDLCCGERDCFELEDVDVKFGYLKTVPGFFIGPIGMFVPLSEAQPSPDGKYWLCQWGGERKCFFAPPQGS